MDDHDIGASERDRAAGALVGLACGDAVGTTLEFKAPGTFTPITDMVGGGPFQLQPGEWTDDTSMALCLAESILDTGGLDPIDQLRRYAMWQSDGYLSSNGDCFDIGSTTATQIARFRKSGQPIDPHPDQEAAANGSLMRLAAVPIRWHADAMDTAFRSAESSSTTHPAARPTDACRVLGAMIGALINGASANDVLSPDFWQFGQLHPAIEAVTRGSWRKEPPEIRGTGYCVDALQAAIWAVAGASDFREAVLRAANLGDDADTTAAIAGQLAGARWGLSGIPLDWRHRVVSGERITGLAYALCAAAGSSIPSAPWAHDSFIHAWWIEPGILAGEYPGHTDSRRATDKVNLLIDAGIRTFVDLTTAADGLVPYAELVDAAAVARKLDIRRHHFPIPDLGVTSDDVYDDLIRTIRSEQQRGGVYVHCWGGVGRTGTVVGCLLAKKGLAYEDIVDKLTELRRGTRKADRPCPETEPQRDVLRHRSRPTGC